MPELSTYDVTSRTARELRRLNEFGMNLVDFAALTTSSSFSNFGNGAGYTVSQWISDGVFANLAAVQAVYPIVQDGADYVDWVLLQSAVDYMIYGNLDSSARKNQKRKLFLPAGLFKINRTLHIGYSRVGTPPTGLGANGYIQISIEGEGKSQDHTQGGLPGTTIETIDTTYPGIALTSYLGCSLKGFNLYGPLTGTIASSNPLRADDNWNRTAWRPVGIADANWHGGAAVHTGIIVDPYSAAGSAAAYPARVLPSYFGGGTSTAVFTTTGGSILNIEDVNVTGYVIGVGRPHGDSNGEFLRLKNVDIAYCINGFVAGHSQNRNVAMKDVNFEMCHTAIGSRGGTTGNANLHGTYDNLHIGRCFQIVDHPNADWSGPLVFRNMYAESFFRIGTFNNALILDGCFLSFLEQEGSDGVPYDHYEGGRLIITNGTQLNGLRHGLFCAGDINGPTGVEMNSYSTVSYGTANNWSAHANAADIGKGVGYMRGVFAYPDPSARMIWSDRDMSRLGRSGNVRYGDYRDQETYLDQWFTHYHSRYPNSNISPNGSDEMLGAVQSYPVPKFVKQSVGVSGLSRSGFDVTLTRIQSGDLKADVGDIVWFPRNGSGDTQKPIWFVVISISGGNMVIRQLNAFDSTTSSDYLAGDFDQSLGSSVTYICTRIRQVPKLFVGKVSFGSNVITNVRHAHTYSTTDEFNSTNFTAAVGDILLHQELERAPTTGGLKTTNPITGIDFTANTITVTNNFTFATDYYPLPFYIEVFNA